MIFRRKLREVWNGESGNTTAEITIRVWMADPSPVRMRTRAVIPWCIVHR
jgi:hypothetical protein